MNSTSSAGGDSTFDDTNGNNFPVPPPQQESSLDYSSAGGKTPGSDSYYYTNQYSTTDDGNASSVTGGYYDHHTGRPSYYNNSADDATEIVHEMHLALLYLLSNPEEFKKALSQHPPRGATTLDEWNAEIETETEAGDVDEESVMTSGTATTPLPFIVFADDAEVVLPQAHTASQLFGIEKVEGIELEAAAGIPALSQLFIRWLGMLLSRVCCF